jgi:hypothetical protein
MPCHWKRLVRAVSSAVGPVGAVVLVTAIAAGCGGGSSSGGSSSRSQSGQVAPPSGLGRVETAQFCRGLGGNGCQQLNTTVESWLSNGHLDAKYAVGALYFAVEGCLDCHAFQGSGPPPQRSKAPDLTHIGGSLNQSQIVAVLHCPTCVHRGSQMPPLRGLSKEAVDQLAAFLAASR